MRINRKLRTVIYPHAPEPTLHPLRTSGPAETSQPQRPLPAMSIHALSARLEPFFDTAAQDAALREHALDWVESQARVLRFWLDRLAGEGGDPDMIALLEGQRQWLSEALGRLREGG